MIQNESLRVRLLPPQMLAFTHIRRSLKQSRVGLNTLLFGTRSYRLRLLEPEPQFECHRSAHHPHASPMERLYAFARYDISYFHHLSAAIVQMESRVLMAPGHLIKRRVSVDG